MITVVRENQLERAKQIMAQYNSKLTYSKVIVDGYPYYAISEGPVGALLLIRAELGDTDIQRRFGLS